MEYPFKDLMPLDEATARDGYYRDWTHIDADTFHQISELAKFIREKGRGSDTREAIAQALERVYHDATISGNANMEVSQARGSYPTLAERLKQEFQKLIQTDEKNLNELIDLIGGSIKKGEIEWADFTQNVREILAGNNLMPALSKDAVLSDNVVGSEIGIKEVGKNNLDTFHFWEGIKTSEKIELYNADKVTPNVGFSGLTETLVSTTVQKTTGYIPIAKGSITDITTDGVSIYDVSIKANPRKIAIFSTNYKWLKTIDLRNEVAGSRFIAEQNCFIRVTFQTADKNISIKSSSSVKLSSEIISGALTTESLKPYYSTARINQLKVDEIEDGWAISGLTKEWVTLDGFFRTDYIYVPKNTEVSIEIDGLSWEQTARGLEPSTKIAWFDTYKTWQTVNYLNAYQDKPIIFDEDGYIRLTMKGDSALTGIYLGNMMAFNSGAIDTSNTGYDVLLVMGQSNMAGRGITSAEHPEKAPNASQYAFEYKAITAPDKLSALVEPFGALENVSGAIDDGTAKTGSMMSSLAKKYYSLTDTKLIAISATEGGTSINQWQPDTPRLNDAINRLNLFKQYAQLNNLKINSINMIWCQGEGDGGMSVEEYKSKFNTMLQTLKAEGIDKCFLVRIGHRQGDLLAQAKPIQANTEIAKENKDVVLVGNIFAELSKGGYLKDEFHYFQDAYNRQGEQAGVNMAYYKNYGKEPMMYDSEFNELYISHTMI